MLTKTFWFSESGVLIRALRTFAQTSIAMLGVSTFSLWTVDWLNLVGTSGAAALLSILMSIDRNAEAPKVTLVESAPPPAIAPPAVAVGCGDSLR